MPRTVVETQNKPEERVDPFQAWPPRGCARSAMGDACPARQPHTLPCPGVVSFDSTVTPTAITPATSALHSECATALAGVRPGVGISREAALRLIQCPDDDVPALLETARAAKQRFKAGAITRSE